MKHRLRVGLKLVYMTLGELILITFTSILGPIRLVPGQCALSREFLRLKLASPGSRHSIVVVLGPVKVEHTGKSGIWSPLK